jgi:thiamine biosynthesis lipoprotein
LERGKCDAAALPPLVLQRALTKIGWQRIAFDAQSVRFTRPGAAITLNGIAQGFATDRIAATLRSCGIQHALIDAGELSALGNKPRQRAWRVGIQHPRQPDAYVALAELSDRCLATSGDYESTFSDDFQVHHILDPRTGTCPRELASVSVVAPTAAVADALSTTIMVLGAEQGERLLRHFPGTDMLVIDKTGRCRHTNRFPIATSPAGDELPLL